MFGLMQQHSLLISSLIEFASRHHGDGEVVSRRVEGDIHRYTWAEVANRSRQMANALDDLGLHQGDRVATLAWNGYRHLELYFGVSGSGRVLHTLNPRLHPDQVVWIANHAEDQVLFRHDFFAIGASRSCQMYHDQTLGRHVRSRQAAPRLWHSSFNEL